MGPARLIGYQIGRVFLYYHRDRAAKFVVCQVDCPSGPEHSDEIKGWYGGEFVVGII